MKTPESPIFRYVASILFFLIMAFSLYLLFRGHNLPGGGFIGGLVASIAILLLCLATGIPEMKRISRVDPVQVATWGVLIATLAGVIPMFFGAKFLQQFNAHLYEIPLIGELHIGTPLAFDLGVYLLVIGICVKIFFALGESVEGHYHLDKQNRYYSSPLEEPIEEHPGLEVNSEFPRPTNNEMDSDQRKEETDAD